MFCFIKLISWASLPLQQLQLLIIFNAAEENPIVGLTWTSSVSSLLMNFHMTVRFEGL